MVVVVVGLLQVVDGTAHVGHGNVVLLYGRLGGGGIEGRGGAIKSNVLKQELNVKKIPYKNRDYILKRFLYSNKLSTLKYHALIN